MRLPVFLLTATALLGQEPPNSSVDYLGLTPAQVAEFVRNLDDHYAWYLASLERGFAVREEITAEALREPVDPLALGLRFAELESNRRELIGRGRALLSRHQSRLTPSQTNRLQILIEASRLSAVAQDAECFYLKENWYGLGGFCHFGRAGGSSASTKRPPRRTIEVRALLERFLQLTPEQIVRYRANQQAFLAQEEAPAALYREAHDEACEALAGAPLDAQQIGVPLARLATLTQEYRRRAEALIDANQTLLTNEQRLRLRVLDEARDLGATASLAETEGFLRRADGQSYLYFSGEAGYFPTSAVASLQNAFILGCHP